MNREEARNLLNNSRPKGNNAYSIMLNEALNMAIKALEQEPYEQDPCDNCKYLDGDGCRLVFEQIEYGKASDECPNDNNVNTKYTVTHGVFEQVIRERDIAISQLKELGYEFGEKIEPCGNAISRQRVLEMAYDMSEIDGEHFTEPHMVVDIEDIQKLPPVNPTKTGHWINVNKGKWNTIPAYKCSVCGENADLRDWSGKSPYCPWCGAKMIEPQESESEG